MRYSDFGFIQKHKFLQLIKSLLPEEDPLIDRLLYLLDPSDEGLVLSTQLTEYVRNYQVYEGLSQFNPE